MELRKDMERVWGWMREVDSSSGLLFRRWTMLAGEKS
jgi:hypothetical protein